MHIISKLGLTIYLFLFVITVQSQDLNMKWAHSTGGVNGDFAHAVTTDNWGNVYIAGSYSDTVDFDPGPGTHILNSPGAQWATSSAYVQKLDPNGNLLWVASIEGISDQLAYDIQVDSIGNAYILGKYKGEVDFDPGTGVHNIGSPFNGLFNIFVEKLDSNGNFVWVATYGNNATVDEAFGLALDNDANVYVTGPYEGTIDFDPGAGTANKTSTGDTDCFIQKLDNSGNLSWVKSIGGGSGDDVGRDIGVDDAGNVYVTGTFEVGCDFDPGGGTNMLFSDGYTDVFILKLSSSGGYIWAKSIEGDSGDHVRTLELDTSGNVYIGGSFAQSVDFDPSAAVFNLTSGGSSDAFVLKLTPSGTFVWAKRTGNSEFAIVRGMDIDASGNTYMTGSFKGTVDFDPGSGSYPLTSNSSWDIYLQKLDSDGNFGWAKGFGGNPDYEISRAIDVDNNGNVYSAGYFDGTMDIDPGPGVYNLVNNTVYADVYVLKLGECTPTYSVDSVTACDAYTWTNGITYSANNNSATDTLVNAEGCDSIITLDLVIATSNTGIDSIIACDSYTWINGITYTTTNNTATDTLVNMYGCDSIVTLALTIKNSTGSTDTITACNSYQWMDGNTYMSSNTTATYVLPNAVGCDSIITLNLTINYSSNTTDSIIACGPYTWIDGIIYNSSNTTAVDTLTSIAGCDSIVTLNLSIGSANTGTDVLTACGNYTWIDGITYNSSNSTATHTTTNISGCDSIVTLNLTINNPSTGIDSVIACDSYTWLDGNTYTTSNSSATHTLINSVGCDSVITLQLTINNSHAINDVIAACEPTTWIDGVTYSTTNNSASMAYTTVNGCDSIIYLDLTITTVEIGVTTNDPTITADANGALYQWLDCNAAYAEIIGGSFGTFTASEVGDYAVEVTQGGCTDTSLCVAITNVSINESTVDNEITIYPNPTSSSVIINIGEQEITDLRIVDISGQLLLKQEHLNGPLHQLTLNGPAGVYFIQLSNNANTQHFKLIKN